LFREFLAALPFVLLAHGDVRLAPYRTGATSQSTSTTSIAGERSTLLSCSSSVHPLTLSAAWSESGPGRPSCVWPRRYPQRHDPALDPCRTARRWCPGGLRSTNRQSDRGH